MSESTREQHLQAILHAYLQAVDRGESPNRQALLNAHSDLRAELAEYFADASKLEALAKSLKTATFGGSAGKASSSIGKIRYFGDYELLEEIARGGMGVVFKAKQVSLNRVVALKMILKGEFASEADVRRFRQEAEAAANLDHPNIVPIYEVGEHEGQQYFSMKLIETEPGLSGIGDNEHSLSVMAQRLGKVARAVHHAHQRGILHRDLKPSNILIDKAGEPHVADFGLAKKVEGGEDATKSGAIVGTPAYMAPEQARAEKSLTTAVDVYSLGAILYEWLTGRPPFRGEDPLSTLMSVVNDEPAKPRSINAKVDSDLETICLKCLDKNPAKRYASAEAFADDLDRWQRGDPIEARPAGTIERLAKWARRRPAAAALVAVSMIGLLLFVTGLLWSLDREHQRAQSERDLREQAVEAKAIAEKAESATRDQVVRFQVRRGIEHLDQRDDFLAFLWFAQALKSESPGSPRGEVHRLRLSLLMQQLPRLRAFFDDPSDYLNDLVFSPDGKQVRTVGLHQGLRHWETDGGGSLGEPLTKGSASSPFGGFIADGELLLYEHIDDKFKQRLSLWDSKDGKLVLSKEQFENPAGDPTLMMLTPTPHRWLKRTQRDKEWIYEVLDLRTLKPIYPPMKIKGDLGPPSIGPGGKQIAFLTEEKKGNTKRFHLHLYDLSAGKSVWPTILVAESDVTRFEYRQVTFSPDGKRLLTDLDADGRRRVRLWNAAKGEPLTPEMQPAYGNVIWRSLARDSTSGLPQQGVVNSFNSQKEWFFVEEIAIGLRAYSYQRLGGFGAPIRPPGRLINAIHAPDGTALATVSVQSSSSRQEAGTDGSLIGLWSPKGHLLHPYLHLPGDVRKLRFSPDGKRLACLVDRNQVFVWDMTPRSGNVPPELPDTHEGQALAFSADGKRVVIGTVEDRKSKMGSKATMRVFETATGKPVSPVIEPYNPESTTYRGFLPEKVVFSADGKRFATLCEGRGKPQESYFDIRIWDATTGEPLTPPIVGKAAVNNRVILPDKFEFSQDGRWLSATLNDGKVGTVFITRVWDTQTGKPFDPGVPYDFAVFSSDGSRVFLTQNMANFGRFIPKLILPASILDVRTGQPLGPPIPLAQCWVEHVCFSPDGERVALETHDPGNHSTHVLDVRTSKTIAGPFAFPQLFDRSFSPDGRRIVCASRERDKARVFDAATGEPLSPLMHLGGELKNVEFAANGQALVTRTNEMVQLWESHTGDPLSPAIFGEHLNVFPWRRSDYSLSGDRKLVVRASGYTLRFLDLTPLDWPTDDIVRGAELLAGRRIDSFGTPVPLGAEEFRRRWGELWPRYLKQIAKGPTS